MRTGLAGQKWISRDATNEEIVDKELEGSA